MYTTGAELTFAESLTKVLKKALRSLFPLLSQFSLIYPLLQTMSVLIILCFISPPLSLSLFFVYFLYIFNNNLQICLLEKIKHKSIMPFRKRYRWWTLCFFHAFHPLRFLFFLLFFSCYFSLSLSRIFSLVFLSSLAQRVPLDIRTSVTLTIVRVDEFHFLHRNECLRIQIYTVYMQEGYINSVDATTHIAGIARRN